MTSLVAKAVGGVANLGAKVTYAYGEQFEWLAAFIPAETLAAAAATLRHGRLTAPVARPPAVEGFTFMFTRPAALLVAAAELSAFLLTAGVRLPLKVAVGTMVAAGTARGLQRLVQVRLRRPAR